MLCQNFNPHVWLYPLLAKEGKDFILKIKVGNQFSFCVESGFRNPAEKSTKNENRKKRKKSPSGMERDRRRRVEFLKRKGILPSAATSDADSGRMVKLDTVSHSAQEEGGPLGGSATAATHRTWNYLVLRGWG